MSSRLATAVLGIALATAALGTSGCTSFEMVRLRNEVDRAMPGADIGPGYAVALGPATVGTVTRALRVAGADGATVRDALRHVRRVQGGVYRLRGPLDADALLASGALRRYQGPDWTPVLTVRDSAAVVVVMARERRGALRDLFVLAAADEALTVARLSGRIDEAVLAILAAAPWEDDYEPAAAAGS